MPSDHTTTSAVFTRLGAQNLAMSDLDPLARTLADLGLGTLTAATAWARIETGAHFPSDTLVGASIGNFFADFFTSAFLLPADQSASQRQLASMPGGAGLRWQVRF